MNPLRHIVFSWCSCALIACLVLLSSCSTNSNERYGNTSSYTDYYESQSTVDSEYQTSYKYNVKYGDGSYNYDVEGEDENGEYVSGNIDIDGKYGSGYIENEYGEEVEIDVEWTGYGELEGTDYDGNVYYLGVY